MVMFPLAGACSVLKRWPKRACARGGDGSTKVVPPSLHFPPKHGTKQGPLAALSPCELIQAKWKFLKLN
ncbi:hypothetical protein V6N12_042584 [Hibiscus sabdariffa]|uniref:Secreted protein n=1 Tax=Hibiscus sabdariffa TaxID=183260 RepID=A0ABR2EFK8_9ROSI